MIMMSINGSYQRHIHIATLHSIFAQVDTAPRLLVALELTMYLAKSEAKQ